MYFILINWKSFDANSYALAILLKFLVGTLHVRVAQHMLIHSKKEDRNDFGLSLCSFFPSKSQPCWVSIPSCYASFLGKIFLFKQAKAKMNF